MRFRNLRWLVLAIAVVGCFAPQVWAAANESIELNSGWKFRQVTNDKTAVAANWLPAQVPGDVHLDLLRNKLIVDPFYRDNEKKLQWIENKDWEYSTAFPVNTVLLNRRNIEIVFEGLDTCAQVYINANLVLTSDNMFRTYRVNAKPYLKSGVNHVRVVFPSPIGCADKIAAEDPWQKETHTPSKDYIRKAGYEYGWDWGPRYVTSGVWQPVRLEAWDKARISDLNVRQLDVTAQTAHILAQVEVTSSVEAPATIHASYKLAGKVVNFSQVTELHPGVNHLDLPITVNHPALWYPAGYGEQPIYDFHADVTVNGAVQDARDVKTGLRSVVLRREPDQWGRSFEFVVNGIPIFAKGANVIPFDSFPNRVTTEQMRQVLQSAKDANMNMVRVWGGGYYPSQSFFEICDELGIMVWQDFMFGNPWMPGTYSFKQNVAQEVEDQLKRLRNHPSIVLWCGNNEQENNFMQDSSHVSHLARLQMRTDYLTVFSGIIPTLVARYDPAVAYWPSSPSGDYEETKNKNYWILEAGDDVGGNEESGDTHDYSIGTSNRVRPRVPFSTELDRHYRFVSEYGFQSLPEMRTIDSFTVPQDRTSVTTTVMASHEKGGDGYETIRNYMSQYYGQPKDFTSLVYGSQIVQAEFIKLMAEHLRGDRPRTMGSMYWQLNDCWPVVSSASVDYYGRWKALQYYARRFYAPLLVYPLARNGTLRVQIISDKTEPLTGSLHMRIMKFDGTVLTDKTENVTIPALSAQIYIQGPVTSFVKLNGIDPATVFVASELTVDGKQVSSNMTYLVPTEKVQLPPVNIESRLTGENGSYSLHLSSKVLARSVYVSFGDADVKVSDNYFDIFPGEPVDIHLTSRESLDRLKNDMKLMSVADAFTRTSVESPLWK